MSEEHSARLSLPLLFAGQAQKEVVHNEALNALDALVQPVAQSVDLAVPPVSPAEGAVWIVATGASGAWAGHDGELAQWSAGGWRFLSPGEGWRVWVADRDADMLYIGGAWGEGTVRGDGLYLDSVRVVAARQPAISGPSGGATVDAQARIAIEAILSSMRNHGLIIP